MKILAILQNQWLHNPERARNRIAEKGPKYRRALLRYALFAGCLTGRRLQQWLGKELCSEIVWDEASPVITCRPDQCPPADPGHVRGAIDEVRPEVVIAFGKSAAEAVWGALNLFHKSPAEGGRIEFRVICVAHPAARQPELREQARQACISLRAEYEAAAVPA